LVLVSVGMCVCDLEGFNYLKLARKSMKKKGILD